MFASIIPQPSSRLKRARAFRRASLIFNPVSGQGNAEAQLATIKDLLEPHIALAIYPTSVEVGAEQLTREAVAQGTELIIASGGDGTVSEVASVLIGTGIPLAVIPRGTANAFANGLGLPTTIEEACIAILQGATLTIDTARCNDKAMLLLAGIGFEAETVQEADRKLKNEFGILAYILAGLDRLQNLVPFTAEITTENEKFTVSAAAVTVANIAPPTSILAQGVGQTKPDDGLLDVTILTPSDALEALANAIELFESGLIHQPTESHHIGYLRAKQVQVTTNPPQAITIDGEMAGETPTTVEIVPASLTVVTFYEQVVQKRLRGLLDLTVAEETQVEVLVVKYYVPPLNWERTLTKVIAEIAETSIAWWETFRRASIEVGELLIKSLHQALAAVAKSIDQLGESLPLSHRAEVDQLEESIPMGETFPPSTAPEIVHQIAGRIRWRIPRLRKDAGYAAQLQQILESVEGVTEVKINSIAASLAVSYTEDSLSVKEFEQKIKLAMAQV